MILLFFCFHAWQNMAPQPTAETRSAMALLFCAEVFCFNITLRQAMYLKYHQIYF